MTMNIEKDMEVDGSIIRSVQRSEGTMMDMNYDVKTCNGGRICVTLFPARWPRAKALDRIFDQIFPFSTGQTTMPWPQLFPSS